MSLGVIPCHFSTLPDPSNFAFRVQNGDLGKAGEVDGRKNLEAEPTEGVCLRPPNTSYQEAEQKAPPLLQRRVGWGGVGAGVRRLQLGHVGVRS